MRTYIAAIDQGTGSTRCMIFDRSARIVGQAQAEHAQHYPQPGWVEHDPLEIWQRTCAVIAQALGQAGISGKQIAAVGLANQRETVVAWDRQTGKPLGRAIVWQDTRTAGLCQKLAAHFGPGRFREKTGLPLATYFSGPKIRWMLEHTPGLAQAAQRGDALCGTIDSYLIWNLTGGAGAPGRAQHVTDVTNASRTLLMNLHSLAWDPEILSAMELPADMLPRIVPSVDPAGWGTTCADGPFAAEIPVCAALGDQQAALLGQGCFDVGSVKNTYGTGCFMLLNTGPTAVPSRHGLLTTVGYQIAGQPCVYALEGSIAIAGALIRWLRDNLGLFEKSQDVEALAASVPDSGGVYLVPAFSGLFAPHWRADARGVIAGLTGHATKGHIARAALEATAYQTRDVLDAMRRDAQVELSSLKVDGGMVANEMLMQFQADVLGIEVVRPLVAETTALGAAFAAGLAAGLFPSLDHLRDHWQAGKTWRPTIDTNRRAQLYAGWQKAVERSLSWVEGP